MSSNTYFGGSPFEGVDAFKVWDKIRQSPVGKVIMQGIEDTGKDLIILPYDKGKEANDLACNAVTQADQLVDAAPKGVSKKRQPYWYRGNEDNTYTRVDERYDMVDQNVAVNPRVGTGTGSDVKIYFTPGQYTPSACGGGVYGSKADEVLFHEMVHALRKMRGQSNPIPTEDSVRAYDTVEEFLAIVVANVYISAKTRTNTGLRADHHGFKQLTAPLNTSGGFLSDQNNLRLMNIYQDTWQPYFLKLSKLTEPVFNPFSIVTVWENPVW